MAEPRTLSNPSVGGQVVPAFHDRFPGAAAGRKQLFSRIFVSLTRGDLPLHELDVGR